MILAFGVRVESPYGHSCDHVTAKFNLSGESFRRVKESAKGKWERITLFQSFVYT